MLVKVLMTYKEYQLVLHSLHKCTLSYLRFS
ncbi:hypothetical protein VPH166E361_0115 [Vibrio phage 166E36-1]